MAGERQLDEGCTVMVYRSDEHWELGIGSCGSCGREPDCDCKRLSFCPNLDCLKFFVDDEVLE